MSNDAQPSNEHAHGSDVSPQSPAPPAAPSATAEDRKARLRLIGVIVALAVGSVLYRLLVIGHLEQTSALFIALPTILALILACIPTAKSATGMALKGTALALLMSGPLLGEGFVCIIMASPLFLLAALVVGLAKDSVRRRSRHDLFSLALIPLMLSGIEGTTPSLTLPTRESVSVTRVVPGSADDVARALASAPRFDKPLPPFLRLKFPVPVAAVGDGLRPGDLRIIHFAGGEGQPGDLTMRVTRSAPGHVHFEALTDASKIAHWLTWHSADVTWTTSGTELVAVTWTTTFDRELDPAWYFGPWERYAVKLATGYLIDCLATPRRPA